MTAQNTTPEGKKEATDEQQSNDTDRWHYDASRTTVWIEGSALGGHFDAAPGEVMLEDAPDGQVAVVGQHGDRPGAPGENNAQMYLELSPAEAERLGRDLLLEASDAREEVDE